MFGTLYRYELKKILTRPYVLLLLVLMVGVTLFLNVKPLLAQEEVAYAEEDGTLVFDTVSRYEAIQLERRFSQEDTGCLLDNEAALEMRELNEYYLEKTIWPVSFLLLNRFLVQDAIGVTFLNPLGDWTDQMADKTYEAIAYWQEEQYQNQRLTQEEIDYWETERAGITTPYTLFYPQLGVKLCSMAGGGVQKIYMVFLREPSRQDRSGSDLFHLRDGFEIKMNFDRNVSCFIFVNALMHDDFFD